MIVVSITVSARDRAGYPHPLAYVRALRGWSQQRLADLLRRLARERGVNLATGKNRVCRWERYGTTPDAPTQRLLAELLDVPSGVVAARPWPGWLPAWDDTRFLFPWSREGALQALAEASTSQPTDVRAFVGLTGLHLTALTSEWRLTASPRLRAALGGRRVDAHLVRSICDRTRQLRSLDDSLGGGALGRLVLEELRLVTGLLRQGTYTVEVGRRLFAVAAELSQLAGWTAFDAGSHGAAQRHYVTALHAAHTAGDRALGAYVLACMSYQLAHAGYARDAVKLALTAVEGGAGAAPQRVTALLRLRLAYAHGVAGDRRECARVLAAAPESGAGPDNAATAEPHWLYWWSPAHARALQGRCLAAIGDVRRATALLGEAIDTEAASFTRDGIVHLVWLAATHLSRNEVEHSCAAIVRASELSGQVNSGRSVELVRGLLRKIAPLAPGPVARDTLHTLAQARSPTRRGRTDG